MAQGRVTVNAVQLPVTTAADQLRLKAAEMESRACLDVRKTTDAEAAAAEYAEAAELHRRTGDRVRAGIAYLQAAGTQYAQLANWNAAAQLAASAARQLAGAEEPLLEAFALRVQGAALNEFAESAAVAAGSNKHTLQQARTLLTAASERFMRLGVPYQAGYALNYRGVSFHAAGDRVRARRDYQQALELFRIAADRPAQALSLQSLAQLEHEDGRLAESVRQFDAALALIPRSEEPASYAHTLHNSALPLRVLGRFDEAIARFHEAGQILREQGDRIGEARALHGIGTTFKHAGKVHRASEYLRAAIELRGDNVAKREQATSLIVLGHIEREKGNLDESVALHTRAAALLTAPNDRAKALVALAQDHLAAGDLAAAKKSLDVTLTLGLPESHRHLGLAWTELAAVASLQGDIRAAARCFAKAIAIHRANGSDLELAGTLLRRAQAMMEAGNTNAAIADSARALELFEEIGRLGIQPEARAMFWEIHRGAVEVQIAALLGQADEFQRRNLPASAQTQRQAAFATSDRYRARLLTDSVSAGAIDRLVSATLLTKQREMLDRLAGKRQRQDRLLDTATPNEQELASIRRDIAWLRSEAEQLENAITGNQLVSRRTSVMSDSDLVRMVPDGVRIAEFFIGENRSWLFDVRQNRLSVHALPAKAVLESLAREVYDSWRTPAIGSADRMAASLRLARITLGPLDNLAAEDRVLIIPDGALHLVPIVSLMRQLHADTPPGSSTIVPSLHAVLTAPAKPVAISAQRLAIVADPVYSSNDPRIRSQKVNRSPESSVESLVVAEGNSGLLTGTAIDFASLRRLPATTVEARSIVTMMPHGGRVSLLMGLDATRDNVTELLSVSYQIVHFATHAFADSEDPALAALALTQWSAAGVPQNGALRQAEITQMRIDADLVVLSACDTALGRDINGEGPIGLSNAFLRAGARAVISTLWQVPDTSTAVLMREFYRELLANSQPASVALHLAQNKVRSYTRWRDPYYWAGFQLVSLSG
jgi:CHAT domain-containing protein